MLLSVGDKERAVKNEETVLLVMSLHHLPLFRVKNGGAKVESGMSPF
jgi:hypothetical protein